MVLSEKPARTGLAGFIKGWCYIMTAAVAAFDELIARCRRRGSYLSVPARTDFRPDQDGV